MKNKNTPKEAPGNWFDNNLDPETRTVYIGSLHASLDLEESGVDTFMAESVIKAIHVLQSISDEPITFIMNNPGGSWYHGMAIYDAIRSTPCVTIIKSYGHAMSMGSVILQAADYRVMMPNAKMMIHYGTEGFYGHTKTTHKWSDEGKKICFQMENIYLEAIILYEQEVGKEHLEKVFEKIINDQKEFDYPRTEKTTLTLSDNLEERVEEYRKILNNMLMTDTILTAEETVALGLADEVFQYPEKAWHYLEEPSTPKKPTKEKTTKRTTKL